MNKLESWLTENSIGKDLLANECQFLQGILTRIPQSDRLCLNIGPINVFKYISLVREVIHVADDEPCDVVSNTGSLPFAENSIDVIVCYHSLEFFRDRETCLREISRILKPEGYLLIVAFNPYRCWWYSFKWQEIGSFRKRDCLRISTLKHLLEQNALQVIEGKFMFYTPFFLGCFNIKQVDFFEKVGDRWWPSGSNVYALVIKKRILHFRVKPVGERLLRATEGGLIPLARSDSSYK